MCVLSCTVLPLNTIGIGRLGGGALDIIARIARANFLATPTSLLKPRPFGATDAAIGNCGKSFLVVAINKRTVER